MTTGRRQHPFNPRLVVGLIVAGVVAFAALVLLIAFGSDIGAGRTGRAHALSVSATGYKGLVNLAGRFRETYLIRDEWEWDGEDLVVVALEPQSRAADLQRLLEARYGSPTLIILPKWITRPDPARPSWVRAVFAGAGSGATAALGKRIEVRLAPERARPGIAHGEDLLAGLSVPVPAQPQIVSGPNLWPLLRLDAADPDAKPGASEPALIAMLGNQPHYIVADPDLLNNHGLGDAARARAAIALLDRLNESGEHAVGFDLVTNGLGRAGSRNMLRLAFEPPFLAMTLALAAAALLAGLHGAFRFGPVRKAERAIAFGKAALVENSAGLIRLAKREARLGGAYADVVRHEAAQATHAPPALQGDALDAYLDRLGRRGRDEAEPSFGILAAELEQARDRHALMAAARALFRWKREVLR